MYAYTKHVKQAKVYDAMKELNNSDPAHVKLPDILGSAGRLRIIETLFHNKRMHVSLIAKKCGLNPSSTKEHLDILHKADLVGYEKVGKQMQYYLNQKNPRIVALGFLLKKWTNPDQNTAESDWLGKYRVIDLSHEISPPLNERQRDKIDFHEGYVELGLHSGTHIDLKDTIPENDNSDLITTMPVRRFFGPAVKLDVTSKRKIVESLILKQDKMELSMDDFSEDEIVQKMLDLEIAVTDTNVSDVIKGDFVLFHTGFDDFWYKGAERPFFEWRPYFVHPYPSRELIQALLKLEVRGIGIDAGTVEPPFIYPKEKGDDQMLKRIVNNIKKKKPSLLEGKIPYAHNACLKNCLFIENLTNLGEIQQKRFMLMCFPLKLSYNIASPVRAVALEKLFRS